MASFAHFMPVTARRAVTAVLAELTIYAHISALSMELVVGDGQ